MEFFLIAFFSFICVLLGSFFTVLIYRLPLSLQKNWNEDYNSYLNYEKLQKFNLKNFNVF